MPQEPPTASLYAQRSLFDGIIVATLGYGALLMLSMQLMQVLLSRPKRGKLYWAIVSYFSMLFVLATFAIGGKLKYAELTFVDFRDYPGGPVGFFNSHLNNHVYIMGQVCTTLVPWVGDIIMIICDLEPKSPYRCCANIAIRRQSL
ncbi:hypothetical protein H0H81_003649 [Sphagnurus paluster]|uniref:Uncharacterized protein n=1 Tax=Sphagnurus paluster TaxID=117069 RepID=A0A9P7FRG3_9AGAR|nr:hypothetical protein H0H81_003649 [Sphagnurus paluster]